MELKDASFNHSLIFFMTSPNQVASLEQKNTLITLEIQRNFGALHQTLEGLGAQNQGPRSEVKYYQEPGVEIHICFLLFHRQEAKSWA